MARLPRVTQTIFGGNAGFEQIAQFGSLAAGTPAFSTNVATIQALSNWASGWFAGVEANNSPAIEDMNAVCYVLAAQLAYILQVGVAEWDSGTTYFIGDVVQDGTGNEYVSVVDNNLNQAVANNPSYWVLKILSPTTASVSVTVPATYSGVIGQTTVPSGVQYTVAGNLSVAGVIQATGTGVVQATGSGVIRAF